MSAKNHALIGPVESISDEKGTDPSRSFSPTSMLLSSGTVNAGPFIKNGM